jgi:isocitrate dehydrogenase
VIEKSMSAVINMGTVTDDFTRLMKKEGRTDLEESKWLEFGTHLIKNM